MEASSRASDMLPVPPSTVRPMSPGRSRRAAAVRRSVSIAIIFVLVAGAGTFLSPPGALDANASPPPATASHVAPTEPPSSRGVIAPTRMTSFPSASATPGLGASLSPAIAPYPVAPRRSPMASTLGIVPATTTAPVDTITVKAAGTSSTQLTLNRSFEGENFYQAGVTPPDVQVAAGPNQVAEMVNLEFAAWSTSGTKLGNESLYTFWGVSTSTAFLSDPRILFDADSGRWFASILEATTSAYLAPFAVSASNNVTGTWTIYTSLAPPSGDLGDQPILGVSHDLLSIGVNDFGTSGYAGAQYWVVNKTAVLNGSSAAFAGYGPYPNDLSIHPARAVSAYDGMYLAETFPGAPASLEIFSVRGVPPATPTVTRTNLTVGDLATPPAAAQPGTTDQLDTGAGSARVMDELWSGGQLWVAYSDTCLVAGVSHACFRLDLINVSGTPSVAQDFNVAVAGTDLLYPAMALDPGGNIVMVFGLSSATATYPSIGATYRTPTDPTSTVRPGLLVRAGTASMGCSGTCRYGDYFGAAAGPGATKIWIGGEYVTGSAPWQTRIAAVLAEGPMSAALRTSASSADVGQPVPISVVVTNSTCPTGASAGCSVVVPFGDGSTGYANCTAIGASYGWTHVYSAAGSYNVGAGASVTAYATPNCASSSRVATYPLAPVSLVIASGQVVQVTASPSTSLDVGQPATLSAQVAGGVGPYSYLWYGLPNGCATTTLATVDCTMQTPGDFTVNATSTDANGATVSGELAVHVDPAPSIVLMVAASAVDVGQTLEFLGTPGGGSGTYQYAWFDLPEGCIGPVDSPSFQCLPQ
ncbi:MAG: PKD domain-containing protein, partial [Thermoplasmata archaeon]